MAIAMGAAGCGTAPIEHAPYEHEVPFVTDAGAIPPTSDAGSDVDPCATRSTGCACDVESQVVECGTVHQQFGDYTRCAPGYRTCVNGAWGPCSTDRIVGAR